MEGSRVIELDGRRVRVTEVFWSYWRLAAERQAIFFRRASGQDGPVDERSHSGAIQVYECVSSVGSSEPVPAPSCDLRPRARRTRHDPTGAPVQDFQPGRYVGVPGLIASGSRQQSALALRGTQRH